MIGRIGRWCVCVLGGVMEINGVRSKGAIRTMEGSKRVGGGGERAESRCWSARHPLSRLRDDV